MEADGGGGGGAQVFHQTGTGRSRSAAAPVANLPLTHTCGADTREEDQRTEAEASPGSARTLSAENI